MILIVLFILCWLISLILISIIWERIGVGSGLGLLLDKEEDISHIRYNIIIDFTISVAPGGLLWLGFLALCKWLVA